MWTGFTDTAASVSGVCLTAVRLWEKHETVVCVPPMQGRHSSVLTDVEWAADLFANMFWLYVYSVASVALNVLRFLISGLHSHSSAEVWLCLSLHLHPSFNSRCEGVLLNMIMALWLMFYKWNPAFISGDLICKHVLEDKFDLCDVCNCKTHFSYRGWLLGHCCAVVGGCCIAMELLECWG